MGFPCASWVSLPLSFLTLLNLPVNTQKLKRNTWILTSGLTPSPRAFKRSTVGQDLQGSLGAKELKLQDQSLCYRLLSTFCVLTWAVGKKATL